MSSTAVTTEQRVSALSFIATAAGYEGTLSPAKPLTIPARFIAFVSRPWIFVQAALFVLTMLVRRNPVRISTNPWFWAVASINSYYNLVTAGLLRGGVHVAPVSLINFLAIFGIWVAIFARLSLGRNIGLVPAQRKIVTRGMYRYMRHPIYSGYFLCAISWGLSCFSLLNALVIGFGCLMFVIKTLMEESFLSEDPEYAAYMKRVRWRWFPGLA